MDNSGKTLDEQFSLPPEKLVDFQEKYPSVDVPLEYEKARNYLLASGGKRGGGVVIKSFSPFFHNWCKTDWVARRKRNPNAPVPFVAPEVIAASEETRAKVRARMAELAALTSL